MVWVVLGIIFLKERKCCWLHAGRIGAHYVIRATNLRDSFEFFEMILGGSRHLFTSYDESFVRRLQI